MNMQYSVEYIRMILGHLLYVSIPQGEFLFLQDKL